jgi:hypothetical protein
MLTLLLATRQRSEISAKYGAKPLRFANSNSYAWTILNEMGLLDEFERASEKRGGTRWAPG